MKQFNVILVLVLFFGSMFNASLNAATRIAIIGNDNAVGVKTDDVHAYPNLLQESLGDSYLIENFGYKGACLIGKSSFLSSSNMNEAVDFNADIVIIDLGLNDGLSEEWAGTKAFYKSYLKLVNKFQSINPDVRIILCKPTPVFEQEGSDDFSFITKKVIPVIELVGVSKDLEVIDLYSAMLWTPNYFPDNINPDSHGMSVISRIISRTIRTNNNKSVYGHSIAYIE